MDQESQENSPSVRPLMLGLISCLLLAILVVPKLVSRLGRTVCPKTNADVSALAGAVSEYAADHGGLYPRSLEELLAPGSRGIRYLDLDVLPRDPWGRPYRYEPPSTSSARPRIFTLGADGEAGGAGEDRDLSFPEEPLHRRVDGGR
ncbi:MAG: hypothetical protein EXS08_11660 [Planctomycetes bacterium]|nr:hypothetical protein [Planctomycetota bacterium]